MIETIVLEPQTGAYATNPFNEDYYLIWPNDTLASLPFQGGPISVSRKPP
jgi:hypothetical protein